TGQADSEKGQGERQAERTLWMQPPGQKRELAPVASTETDRGRTLELAAGERVDLLGISGEPTGDEEHAADEHDDNEEQRPRWPGVALDPPVGITSGVAQRHEAAGPDDPSGHVPGEERAVRHAGDTGKGRDEGPEHADEPAEEDRPATLVPEVGGPPLPPGVADP